MHEIASRAWNDAKTATCEEDPALNTRRQALGMLAWSLIYPKEEGYMADWRITGVYFKGCNCHPGCPCDFMKPPTYETCEGVLGMYVEQGHFDPISRDGAKWAVAYHRPGPLHEGNGTLRLYFDPATTPEQMGALGQILTGQAGGIRRRSSASEGRAGHTRGRPPPPFPQP